MANDTHSLLQKMRAEPLVLRLWQAGRELLHSNMLAYLLESTSFARPLLNYLWGSTCEGFHVRALREQNGIDLLVLMLPRQVGVAAVGPDNDLYWKSLALTSDVRARLLVIENKFKSLPDEAQLQKYADQVHAQTHPVAMKVDWYRDLLAVDEPPDEAVPRPRSPYLAADVRLVILTPSRLCDIPVNVDITHSVATGEHQRRAISDSPRMQVTWVAREWRGIAQQIGSASIAPGELESMFVHSYGRLLEAACALQERVQEHCDDHAQSFAALDATSAAAGQLRLGDFVEKWRHQHLARHVRDELRREWSLPQAVVTGRGIEQHLLAADDKIVVIVSTFFSRGTGGTDVGLYRRDESTFAVNVQVQGNRMKLMFALPGDNEDAQRLAAAAAFSELTELGGTVARLFNTAWKPGELRCYEQDVRLCTVAHGQRKDAVSIRSEKGRLVYQQVNLWLGNPGSGRASTPAGLSCRHIATDVASVALEIVKFWPLLASACQRSEPSTSH